MQISKESRPEKGEAPAIRDTRRGFFRAANCGGGDAGDAALWIKRGCATSYLPVNFLSSTQGSVRSCRARFANQFDLFRSPSHFGSGIETMAGTNLIRLVAGRCSYPQAASSFVTCLQS